jgi:branched-chain amino acid transport system permease protein
MINYFSQLQSLPTSSKVFYLLSLLLVPLIAIFFEIDGLNLAIEIVCYIALAQLWNLLAGYAGLMSIGQQLFIGLGAYALFLSVIYMGMPIYASLLAAPLFSFLVAYLISKIVFRLNGAYFAIGTWVLADAVMLMISKVEFFGGASGLSLPIQAVKNIADSGEDRQIIIWILAALLSVAVTLVSHLLLRSKLGLGLTSIRDSEDAARSLGVNVFSVKKIVYLYVAVMTALCGAIIFLQKIKSLS